MTVRGRTLILLLVAALAAPCSAQPIAELLQGTNLALALAPNGQTFVIDLAQQLWRVPATGGGAEPLTPPGEPARNPRYSPDGARVVYQRLSAGHWDLWLLDLTTSERLALTATPDFDEREPEFASDGRSVIFASNRTGHMCLWSIALDGGVETQLTEEPGDASFPTASELGPVAYVLDRGEQSELRALLPNGTTTTLLSGTERIGAPSWRPGGGVVMFSAREGTAGSRLWMLVLGEPEVRKALSGPEDVFRARPAWLSSSEFVYTADGQIWRRGIAAQSRRPVHMNAALAVDARSPPADLPQVDDPAPQTAHGFGSVAVAPDGKRAALTALGDLWLLERGGVKRLTDDVFVDLDPTFTPDGESIVFSSERSGQFELWRIGVRGGPPTQLTFGASHAGRPAVSGDGKRVAFIEQDGLDPSSTARVAVADLARPGQPTTVASGLIGAERPTWGADGHTLGLRLAATGVRSASVSGALSVELSTAADAHAAIPEGLRPVEIKWEPAASPDDYVVEVGRLFDGIRGDYRHHVDVHISRGRITAIVGRGVLPNPARVVDARDATIIPGLIDVHAHESSVVGERLGRAWLAFGVTTVREITNDVSEAVERGETWANGRSPGPRLIVSAATGGVAPPPEALSSSVVPVRPYPGIADGFGHSLARQARELAVPELRTDIGRPWRTAPGSGPHYELEVSPEFASYQDTIATMIVSMTTLAPSLGSVAGLRNWPDSALSPRFRETGYAALFTEAERSSWAAARPAGDASARLGQVVLRFVRAGGRVAIGTDAPGVPYGLGVHYELALLAAAGIPNDQVLRLATAEGALALGLEQELGTLEEGKLADFVVLDGDPLERLTDTLRVKAVVKGGRWFDRAQLLTPPE